MSQTKTPSDNKDNDTKRNTPAISGARQDIRHGVKKTSLLNGNGVTRLEDVPVLTYSSNGATNNLLAFKKAMGDFASYEYGRVGDLFRTGTKHVPDFPKPKAENLRLGITQEVSKVIFDEDVKAYARKLGKVEEDEVRLFGAIILRLSDHSRDRISQDSNWGSIESSKDPLALWKIILATHSGSGSNNHIAD
jgi:hypothetical protein